MREILQSAQLAKATVVVPTQEVVLVILLVGGIMTAAQTTLSIAKPATAAAAAPTIMLIYVRASQSVEQYVETVPVALLTYPFLVLFQTDVEQELLLVFPRKVTTTHLPDYIRSKFSHVTDNTAVFRNLNPLYRIY